MHLCLALQDLDEPTLEGVREGQHRELDDRIVHGAEPRRLAVDVEPSPQLRAPGIREPGEEHERMQGAGLLDFFANDGPGMLTLRANVLTLRATCLQSSARAHIRCE